MIPPVHESHTRPTLPTLVWHRAETPNPVIDAKEEEEEEEEEGAVSLVSDE
jgi:hypothetical protein